MKDKHKISVFGTGFVGLVTAAVFADKGWRVIAVDIDKEKVEKVNNGEPFFYEPNLESLLKRAVFEQKTLTATTKQQESVLETSMTFICVGTPTRKDGSCNLDFVRAVTQTIGKALAKKKDYHLVVVKSTVVPETTRKVVLPLLEKTSGKKVGKDFGLCMNPEFLREGQSIHDTIFPDRIIVGEIDERSGETLANLYAQLYDEKSDAFSSFWSQIYGKKPQKPPIKRYSLETAELIKYANNCFLATKISFVNELANICEQTPGADINDIADAMGLDFRINPHFLKAGAGFGGSCFPKDVGAIISYALARNYQPNLLESVLAVNAFQAQHMVELVEKELGALKGMTIALLGLSFKPGTDDMRNAPSLTISELLRAKQAKVIAWDPKAIKEARKEEWLGEKITYATSLKEALTAADACLLVTDWPEFKTLTPVDFKCMRQKILIDGRRIYDPAEFLKAGIHYRGIGLGMKENGNKNSQGEQ
ncbi:MAG: UDP-glucose dehydrogenase family protein [Candidatus Heimdallarchaeota archaeon]